MQTFCNPSCLPGNLSNTSTALFPLGSSHNLVVSIKPREIPAVPFYGGVSQGFNKFRFFFFFSKISVVNFQEKDALHNQYSINLVLSFIPSKKSQQRPNSQLGFTPKCTATTAHRKNSLNQKENSIC